MHYRKGTLTLTLLPWALGFVMKFKEGTIPSFSLLVLSALSGLKQEEGGLCYNHILIMSMWRIRAEVIPILCPCAIYVTNSDIIFGFVLSTVCDI